MSIRPDNPLIPIDRESIYRSIIIICKILSIYDYNIGYGENEIPIVVTATATGEVADLPSELPDLLKSLEDLLDQAVIFDKIFKSNKTVKPLGLKMEHSCPPLPNRTGYIEYSDANVSSTHTFYATSTERERFLDLYRFYSNKIALFRISSVIQTKNHIIIEFYGDCFTYHPDGNFPETAEYGRRFSYTTEEINLFFDELEFGKLGTFAETEAAVLENEKRSETETLDDIFLSSSESPEDAIAAETDAEIAPKQGIEIAEIAEIVGDVEVGEGAEDVKMANSPATPSHIPKPAIRSFTDADTPIPVG